MTDIVERLRSLDSLNPNVTQIVDEGFFGEVADEIERLREELATINVAFERAVKDCHIAADEIKRLHKVGHDAFMAMCAYRDNGDEEVFQDAIDALGVTMGNQQQREDAA